jgi:hypothetical protein
LLADNTAEEIMTLLEPVDLDFLDQAPVRMVFTAEVPAPRAEVFAKVSGDPSGWSWFPGLKAGSYEGPEPWGVGARRWVTIGNLGVATTYRETILAWDEPVRWTYRVDESDNAIGLRQADALVEDWTFRDAPWCAAGVGGATIVDWTFAIRPSAVFRLALPVAPFVMGRLFRRAMRQLGEELQVERRVGSPA